MRLDDHNNNAPDIFLVRDGVRYACHDSANANAAWYALQQLTPPIIWICGAVAEAIPLDGRVRLIISISESPVKHLFSEHVAAVMTTDSLQTAALLAMQMAQAQDTILYSAGCAGAPAPEAFKEECRNKK